MEVQNCLVLLVVAVSPVFCDMRCPDTWVRYIDGCYKFGFDQWVTFTEAEHYCEQHNSHLVEVDDAHEYNFLWDYVHHFKHANWWIGLTDRDIEAEWRWVNSDTAPTYTHWSPTEPDQGHR